MDLLRFLIVGIGCVILGIVIALIAHNLWTGIGVMVLSLLGFYLVTLVKGFQPPTHSTEGTIPSTDSNKDN